MAAHLEREIGKLKKNLLSLSALAEDTFYRAVLALRERDAVLAQRIIAGDAEIDQREVDIEEECQKILALHQPVAHDLRFIIAVLKINAELERIGDAAVNIAERVLFLSSEEAIDAPFDFVTMAKAAQAMLHRSLDALVNLDADLAYSVIGDDDAVDALNRDMYGKIEAGIRRDPVRVGVYIHLLGVSRHIERVADHATNIAEDVVYLVDGTIVRHRTEEYLRTRH